MREASLHTKPGTWDQAADRSSAHSLKSAMLDLLGGATRQVRFASERRGDSSGVVIASTVRV